VICKCLILFLIFFLFSCSQKDSLIDEIQQLEYARSQNQGIFDQYILSDNAETRLQVALTIGRIQDSVHLEAAIKLTADTDTEVSVQAIFALGQIGNTQSRDYLQKIFAQSSYAKLKPEIIKALGKIKGKATIDFLVSVLPSVEDSLRAFVIEGIAFQTTKPMRKQIGKQLAMYLSDQSKSMQHSVVYYYARNPYTRIVPNLLEFHPDKGTLTNKYRLRAIDRGITRYQVSTWDSLITDSLRNDIIWQLNDREIPWQTKLYQLSILAQLPDSMSTKTLAEFLYHENPHLRNMAISGLGKQKDSRFKKILLNYYNDATWEEKGKIIQVLAGLDRHLAYRLIQQNLDQGTQYFKQLLLKGLAIIKDRSSIRQLRQFLIVPNTHLNYTAFTELARIKYISYKDVEPFLSSGDLIKTTIAADWVVSNPGKGNLEDLVAAYKKFSEPDGGDAMHTIVLAIEALQTQESIPYLTEYLKKAQSKSLIKGIETALVKLDVKDYVKPLLSETLFVPDTIINQDVVEVVLITSRGDITLELQTDIAPITVSNFILLAEKKYYNQVIFHRVVSDFVVQAGDPTGTGWGGPGYSLPCEYSRQPFERGSIGMATSGKDTGGSQFFICHSEQPHLNRRYTVFGKVKSGMDIVDQIQMEDKIIEVKPLN